MCAASQTGCARPRHCSDGGASRPSTQCLVWVVRYPLPLSCKTNADSRQSHWQAHLPTEQMNVGVSAVPDCACVSACFATLSQTVSKQNPLQQAPGSSAANYSTALPSTKPCTRHVPPCPPRERRALQQEAQRQPGDCCTVRSRLGPNPSKCTSAFGVSLRCLVVF
jgi:hypothetical protein